MTDGRNPSLSSNLSTNFHPSTLSHASRLERGIGVLDQHLKVSLVPGTGLRRRLESVRLSAERVVADGAGIRGTIGLTTGLDPDKGIRKAGASVGGGADTETGAVDVAPVAPLLAEMLDTVAAGIDDGLAGHASRLEFGREGLDVELLVLALVPLGVGGIGELSGAEVPGVPAGNVGGDTADLLGGASVLVNGGELLGTGLEVVVPAEPAAVAGIDVHDDVGEVELLEGICDTLTVAGGRVLAGLLVDVGDQVGQAIGLDDKGDGSVGVLLEELDDGCIGISLVIHRYCNDATYGQCTRSCRC